MLLTSQKRLIEAIGVIHIIGIGGIGMSGIAEILHNLGYPVQGSDLSSNANTTRLEAIGIKIFYDHNENNVQDTGVIVRSTAVKESNPEIQYALANKIPVISRSEMLAEIMRMKIGVAISGTHGKTTTTSLVSCMFEAANMQPTVINGGIINTVGTNAYVGSGDYIIAEADESDATFIHIPSTIGVITNIDPEHLDYYGSFENAKQAYRTFIQNLPFYGFGVLCTDHPEVKAISSEIKHRKVVTYGLEEGANFQAININVTAEGSYFDVQLHKGKLHEVMTGFYLPTPGFHNVQNALAAVAIAFELGFDRDIIINGFKQFQGVGRRFTKTGEVHGILVVDDYAHHPKEVEATLKTARIVANNRNGRVVAVLQPHRYTRLANLFDDFASCFNDADIVYISDIYSAGEQPIAGISSGELVKAIAKTNKQCFHFVGEHDLPSILAEKVKTDDIILCMGAGTITKWAYNLPEALKACIEEYEKA